MSQSHNVREGEEGRGKGTTEGYIMHHVPAGMRLTDYAISCSRVILSKQLNRVVTGGINE